MYTSSIHIHVYLCVCLCVCVCVCVFFPFMKVKPFSTWHLLKEWTILPLLSVSCNGFIALGWQGH